jgi:hypothetical protein
LQHRGVPGSNMAAPAGSPVRVVVPAWLDVAPTLEELRRVRDALENSLRHLLRSSQELEDALLAAPADPDFVEAVIENKRVISRYMSQLRTLQETILTVTDAQASRRGVLFVPESEAEPAGKSIQAPARGGSSGGAAGGGQRPAGGSSPSKLSSRLVAPDEYDAVAAQFRAHAGEAGWVPPPAAPLAATSSGGGRVHEHSHNHGAVGLTPLPVTGEDAPSEPSSTGSPSTATPLSPPSPALEQQGAGTASSMDEVAASSSARHGRGAAGAATSTMDADGAGMVL